MRLKSSADLFLIFQLINWSCLLIGASSSIRVVCRFNRNGAINKIDLNFCTHILLTNSEPILNENKEDCKVRLRSDAPINFMEKVKTNPQMKVMLSLTPSDFGKLLEGKPPVTNFQCRNNTNKDSTTADAIVELLKENKFDGLDIDEDFNYLKKRFPDAVKKVLEAMQENKLLFSVTIYNDLYFVRNTMHSFLPFDLINLDASNNEITDQGSHKNLASHHSPLFKNFPNEFGSRFVAIDDIIPEDIPNYLRKIIVIGIPLWSRSWTIPSNVTDTRPPFNVLGDGPPGIFEKQSGLMSYREICHAIQTEGWQVFYEDNNRNISPLAISPITGSNRVWVSYEDPATVVFKLKYTLSKELGGVYLDLTDYEDFNNTCGLGPYQIFVAIATTLNFSLAKKSTIDEVLNTNITITSALNWEKNVLIRCDIAFAFGLLVVFSYVIVLIYTFLQCYFIKIRNQCPDVVVIYENIRSTSSTN